MLKPAILAKKGKNRKKAKIPKTGFWSNLHNTSIVKIRSWGLRGGEIVREIFFKKYFYLFSFNTNILHHRIDR